MFKSIKTGVLALILASSAIYAQAQKKINEGSLTYGVEYKLTDEQKQMMQGMPLPNETKIKFNGNLTKINMEQGPALISIITDNAQKTGIMLVDVPVAQKQYAVKQSKAEIEKALGATKYSDFKPTGEKQTIAGYNSEKYTYKDDKGGTHELWATKDVELPQVGAASYFPDLKAFPVKYSIVQNGVGITATLKALKEEKVGALSIEVPGGYEVTTMEDLMKMGGGE
ncbi:DUF4412 domain-containing protein [Pedobacter sp. SYP-B3415]|uniref:DUF4412 domain-containing protein n=1 Tax=Pedobacter sp. SYP-B3415 TaxID=2496641 RepID=UPI00101D509F|nr:DUF4412 domain-containing protein [Pedobacter sp. SYP-B3415]